MCTVAIATVKNEADIIEAFVRHTLAIVDHMVVLDNKSNDCTLDILHKLASEGLPLDIVEDSSLGKRQAERMTWLMRERALDRHGANWVLPLDADEFVVVTGPRLIPEGTGSDRPLAIAWRSYVPDDANPHSSDNPVARITRRLRRENWKWTKVMVPAELARLPDAHLTQGNHELQIGSQVCDANQINSAYLAHFPIRSPEQFLTKTAINSLQYLVMPERRSDWGWHYRQFFKQLRTNPGELATKFRQAALNYAVPEHIEPQSETVQDPIPYLGTPLRYSAKSQQPWNALRVLTCYAEDLARRYVMERHSHEEELNRVRERLSKEASRANDCEEHLQSLRKSWTWRAGRVLVGPAGWLKRRVRRSIDRRRSRRHQCDFKARTNDQLALAQRIVLGAGGTRYPGWESTDRHVLDITRRNAFARHWAPKSRQAFLAEHVWEHLTPRDARKALRNCFEFLQPGGWLRLAVPDGLHPDLSYLDWVRPGGIGPGADDHKVLYDYRSLVDIVEHAGFRVRLLEYWNENGQFHCSAWDSVDGHIGRSAQHDPRNESGNLKYTSLILDAVKSN